MFLRTVAEARPISRLIHPGLREDSLSPTQLPSKSQSAVGLVPTYLWIAVLLASGLSATMFGLPALAPVLGPTFGVSNVQLGLLTSALMLSHAIAQVASGWFIGQLGLRRAALVLAIFMFVVTGIIGAVAEFWTIVGLRFALGFGTGVAFVVGSAYVAVCAPTERSRSDQALFGACTGFGAALAFILLPVGLPSLGWRAYALTPLALLGVAALRIWRFQLPAASEVARPIAPRALLRLFVQRHVLALGIAHLGSFGIFVALTSWLTALLIGSAGGQLDVSLTLSAALLVFSGVARWSGGPALRWWNERQVIFGSLACTALALGGLGFARGLELQLVLALIAIWCCSFTFASVFQLCYLVSKPGEGASTVGLVSSIAVAGSALLPAAFGLSADLTGGFTLGFAIFAVVALTGALAGLLAPSQ